jgi:hypothetical protein
VETVENQVLIHKSLWKTKKHELSFVLTNGEKLRIIQSLNISSKLFICVFTARTLRIESVYVIVNRGVIGSGACFDVRGILLLLKAIFHIFSFNIAQKNSSFSCFSQFFKTCEIMNTIIEISCSNPVSIFHLFSQCS